VIIYAAMLLSDQYNLPWALRPFMDALTVVTLDLSMDAVAIRLHFWQWCIPLNREWYGVPFDNLVGWIIVALSFSFLIRFIRTLNPSRLGTRLLMLFSPLLSYLGLCLGLLTYTLVSVFPYEINDWANLLQFNYKPDVAILYNPQVELWKLLFLVVIMVELVNVVIWSAIQYRKRWLKHFDLVSFTILTSIHLFFFVAIFTSDLYRTMPILAVLSIGCLSVHLLLHVLPYLINPSTLYVFRKIEKDAKVQEKRIVKVIDLSFR